jgi:excisionase family DNA binding protein
MSPLIDVQTTAELLGLRVPTIRKFVQNRSIPFVKLGARVLFDPEKLAAWCEERSVPASGAATLVRG